MEQEEEALQALSSLKPKTLNPLNPLNPPNLPQAQSSNTAASLGHFLRDRTEELGLSIGEKLLLGFRALEFRALSSGLKRRIRVLQEHVIESGSSPVAVEKSLLLAGGGVCYQVPR